MSSSIPSLLSNSSTRNTDSINDAESNHVLIDDQDDAHLTSMKPRPIVESLGNGNFLLNGEKMTLDQLIMALEFATVNLLETQLAAEMENINQRNKLLEEANQFLSEARALKGALDPNKDNAKSEMPRPMAEFFIDNGVQQGISDWDIDNAHKKNGKFQDSDGHDFIHTKDEWQTSIENLKSFIDSLNSRSQLDMVRISSLLKKRDEAITIPANTNHQFHQTNQGIINKI